MSTVAQPQVQYDIKNPEDVAKMMEAMSTTMAKAGGEFLKTLSPEQQKLARKLLGDGLTGTTAEQLIVDESEEVTDAEVRGMMRDLPSSFVE